jgi:hypothetical protein
LSQRSRWVSFAPLRLFDGDAVVLGRALALGREPDRLATVGSTNHAAVASSSELTQVVKALAARPGQGALVRDVDLAGSDVPECLPPCLGQSVEVHDVARLGALLFSFGHILLPETRSGSALDDAHAEREVGEPLLRRQDEAGAHDGHHTPVGRTLDGPDHPAPGEPLTDLRRGSTSLSEVGG